MDVEEIDWICNQIKGRIKTEVTPELQAQFKELGVLNIVIDAFSWSSSKVHFTLMFKDDSQLKRAKVNKFATINEFLNKLCFKLVIEEQ